MNIEVSGTPMTVHVYRCPNPNCTDIHLAVSTRKGRVAALGCGMSFSEWGLLVSEVKRLIENPNERTDHPA